MSEHHYKATITWTGNLGSGTSNYRAYERNHVISVIGKPEIPASSDPSFRGDKTRYNPEELLVSSLSSCHMLWYLHLCSVAGVVVVDYSDEAIGVMVETADGGGYFKDVTLFPKVTVTEASMIEKANALHHEANKMCFVANSVNFPVKHSPTCQVSDLKK
ncbi:OsmC family protein [Mucilaginibacter sp. BJC16-A38]|uniref:OsmC family protein n=1 Tax=Mucilaginibacter phenanthrenivorans TaxID=1234842 RepID=UPI0021577615|nr:OsmC family protein [Mucilaginibacter phenanthrenivorans]MCR8556025.1 OsmC family protein [Mucilaginibacter phenanthrenivorans]